MGIEQQKKRSSHHGTNVLSVVPPSLGNPLIKKPVGGATGKKASLTHYSGTAGKLQIPFTLITAVCPFEANRRLSLQQLRDPFNTAVCAASHQPPLSETPTQCLLLLINVFVYPIVVPIIGFNADFVKGNLGEY